MVSTRGARTKRPSRKAQPPLDVDLTLVFRFGDAPEDQVTVLDQQRVPMVDSVFASRDVIQRHFVKLLLKAAVAQPRVMSEILPLAKLLRRGR